MHLPPGMEWGDNSVTQLYLARDNNSNATNGSDITATSFTGATIASPIIMFICGVIGNLLALLVLRRTRMESQRLMFHSLVAGLVWNDLLGIVLTSPVSIASYINGLQMPGGEHLCRFNGFIMICFGLSTPLIVSAMAIERFLFVKYTFFYTKHCAPGAAKVVMLAIWGFVLFFGLLPMFGFGSYVLQYPRTWCFLDFRTNNPVHAAYGYLYSTLNLLLVATMVVCNLVVVATLARVRDYRRKHSTSSVNSVLIGDGVIDDSQRQQAMLRRRKQKDIELQMIVVMCAITTIFAVCWAPLMIYITLTLASSGETDHVFGLVAIRLASLNQTLNPWLYVILRRALIIRVKKYCCRWRKYFRKKSNPNAAPVGRRHQYVHVRNQLCHRSNFVGGDLNHDSLSDSMRRSLQQAIPAAMSLPDVMMVNTGRRDLDMPTPDMAKALSYAGRVSHSYSLGSVTSCAYCNSPAVVGCAECFAERYGTTRAASKPPQGKHFKDDIDTTSEEGPKCPNNSKVSTADAHEVSLGNGNVAFSKKKQNGVVGQHQSSKICDHETQHHNGHHDRNAEQDKGTGSTENISKITKDRHTCPRHSTGSKPSLPAPKEKDAVNLENNSTPSDSIRKKMNKELFSMTSSSFHGWSRDSRLSQHMHKPRNNSKSSSSKSSGSKTGTATANPAARLSVSNDATGHHNKSPPERRHSRKESARSEHQLEPQGQHELLNDSKDSDDVFYNENDVTCMETRKDMTTTTTDDVGFSSMPTDSVYISDTTTEVKPNRKPFVNKFYHRQTPNSNDSSKEDSNSNQEWSSVKRRPPNDKNSQKKTSDAKHEVSSEQDSAKSHILSLPSQSKAQNKTVNKPYNNRAYNRNSSDSSSYLLREVDSDEERSSGIFSADSPARNSKDLSNKPKWNFKKESQSEVTPETKPVTKEAARRVKSYN